MPEVIEQAVPGTVVSSGALVTPGGAQGPGGSTGPQGPPGPSGSGTGDMLKSVYDTNSDNVVDHAALADIATNATNATNAAAVPWTGVTGKPSTFAPSAHGTTHLDNGADVVPVVTTARTGLAPKLSGSATTYLDGTGAYSAPPGTAGNMLKSVYDSNADNIVDQAAAVPWTGVTGKPATFPPDATAELVARKGVASGYPSLDGSALVPIAQLPAPASGDAAAAQLVKGNDSRLTNARTPTAHASTHVTGGSDIIAPASSSTAGLLKQLSGNATDFVDGTNACQNLVTAIDPEIWSVRRSFNACGNSNFEITQRDTGIVQNSAASNAWLCDRWQLLKTGAGTINIQNQSNTGIVVPGTSYRITGRQATFSLATPLATLAAGDFIALNQLVEGSSYRELASDATSISLLVQSTVANQKFSVAIRSADVTKSLVKLCTIPTANVPVLITLPNIPVAPTSFITTPGVNGYTISIVLSCGTTLMAPAADTFQNGNFLGAPGMTNWSGSPTNSSFFIYAVQHESGPVCSTFQDKPFIQNYSECQRYFTKSYDFATAIGTATGNGSKTFLALGAFAGSDGTAQFPVPMAKVPTTTIYNHATGAVNSLQDGVGTNHAVNSLGSLGSTGFSRVNFTTAVTGAMQTYFHYTADTGW